MARKDIAVCVGNLTRGNHQVITGIDGCVLLRIAKTGGAGVSPNISLRVRTTLACHTGGAAGLRRRGN